MQIKVQGKYEPVLGIFRKIPDPSPGARPSSLEPRDYFWPDARPPVRLLKPQKFTR